MKKIAVVLFNLGGPDSLNAIQPFLFNLFCDPDIFKIPFGQKIIAGLISKRRAPKVAEQYKKIGGKSPIGEWTELQRASLEKALNESADNATFTVFTAMRYWNPLTKKTAEDVLKGNFDKVVLLPLYPHFSVSTTGSSFNEWKRVSSISSDKLVKIESYFDDSDYISVINEHIDLGLSKFDDTVKKDVVLLFSAHGTPVSFVKKGDPYSHHIKKTVEAVMKSRRDNREHRLCFQSKVGPVKWLEPSTENTIRELAEEGKLNLLVIPISFVSDHIETLFELDIEYRHVADECKVENYRVMPGFNGSASFVNLLKKLTLTAIS